APAAATCSPPPIARGSPPTIGGHEPPRRRVRVLIDTTYALRGPSGTATYLEGLVPALRESGVDVVEHANHRRRPPGTGSLRNWLEDQRFAALQLPRYARAVGAVALVHPALHEGFGLTLAEAPRAGVPVVAGRAPGVVETAGDAALYADPRDPDDLAAALARIAADPDLRARLAERGRQRADGWSWSQSARAHMRAYTLALG